MASQLLEHPNTEPTEDNPATAGAIDAKVTPTPPPYGALLAGLAHDLKNPLTRIRAGAGLLDRRLQWPEPVDREAVRAGLRQIEAAAVRMAMLLDELVDAASLRAGEPLALRLRPTDLVQLARQAVVYHQQTSERHTIAVDCDEPSIVGRWDPSRIERVLANLLSNAIKFSPAGGEVRVSLARNGEWVAMRVRDEGLGIPARDLPHIFDGCHRAGNVVGRVAGTGLGLTGVRQIVEQHGGTISVASAEGRGSTFLVRLPLEIPTAGPAPGQAQ